MDGMRFFYTFDGFVVFADHFVDVGRVGEDIFELSYSSKLLFPFVSFDGISSFVLFDFLIGLELHDI